MSHPDALSCDKTWYSMDSYLLPGQVYLGMDPLLWFSPRKTASLVPLKKETEFILSRMYFYGADSKEYPQHDVLWKNHSSFPIIINYCRPPDKSPYWKIIFLISQQNISFGHSKEASH